MDIFAFYTVGHEDDHINQYQVKDKNSYWIRNVS